MNYLQIFFLLFISLLASTLKAEETNYRDNIIDEKIRSFILENPEIILESLRLYEEKKVIEAKKTEKELILHELQKIEALGLDYSTGNQEGAITLVEFLDYKCGYYKKFHNEIDLLLKDNPDLKFVVKELPILGEQSIIAAKASIAMLQRHGPIMYEKFTQNLFKYSGILNKDTISNLINSLGADLDQVLLIMESDSIYSILNSNLSLAKKLNISGTPTFIIGTEIIKGYKDPEAFQEIINLERQAL